MVECKNKVVFLFEIFLQRRRIKTNAEAQDVLLEDRFKRDRAITSSRSSRRVSSRSARSCAGIQIKRNTGRQIDKLFERPGRDLPGLESFLRDIYLDIKSNGPGYRMAGHVEYNTEAAENSYPDVDQAGSECDFEIS